MAYLSPAQVLAELKQNGSYDSMRQEMLKAFSESGRGKEIEKQIGLLVERFGGDSETAKRGRNNDGSIEKRVLGYIERQSRLERLETDARNYWLKRDTKESMKRSIFNAMDKACKAEEPERLRQSVSRALELEAPRVPAHGAGASAKSHSFYRIGDAAAAFVPTGNSFLSSSPQYTCVSVKIDSCDAPKNMYMVRDPDAAHRGALQEVWAVYWDQLIALKRPYDHKHREGDQVYALYRNDLGTDTAVSTEFFPGRVERVSQMSIAVRFDTGELSHVYYDELFAAGRVGFLRQQSEERKRRGASDSMVEVHGRFIPSFTGFWPSVAQPGLGKHGRKTRYRQMPPLLVDIRSADKYYLRSQFHETRAENHSAVAYESDRNSDMDTGSSSVGPESPAPKAVDHDRSTAHTKQQQQQQPISNHDNDLEHNSNQASLPSKPTHPVSPEEDGEIDAGPNEEGECLDERALATSPRTRDSSSSRRYSDYRHRPARRRSSNGRADYHYHDRPLSRGRQSRFDDRERSPYRRSRDEWGTSNRRSSGYRDSGYRERRRSRSRSRSKGRGRADPYGSSPVNIAHPHPRVVPDTILLSPQQQQQQPQPIVINPFQPVGFEMPMQPMMQPQQDRVDMRDHHPYQHPRQPDRRHGDYRHER
ncbi:hypothetical protein LPJ81_004274 [Coemansia sp. IMI 209127]|nr:hypothetical protein LPJ81_004274 [Coemansia sp. IMI 209127]